MSNKKLSVLFDANPIVDSKKSGVGYYSEQLMNVLANEYPDINFIGHYFNFLGKNKKPSLVISKNIKYKESRLLHPKILSLCRKLGFQLPIEVLFKQSGDVALFTNFVCLPSLTNIKKITFIHDLCYFERPEFVSDKNRLFLEKFVNKSIKISDSIITISEASKLAIIKNYGLNEQIIHVTPIPPPEIKETELVTNKNLGVSKSFILFLGTLEPRKNFINLVKAYELLPNQIKSEYQLVLAGGYGWKIENELEYIKKLNNKNIIITGYTSDNQKKWLYKNASVFVLPSHYEGFGMPILEAMSYGVPTLVSDIPVFNEVSDKASIYFDKDKPEDISKKLNNIITDKDLQKDLSKKGHERLKKYSWENNAKIIRELF